MSDQWNTVREKGQNDRLPKIVLGVVVIFATLCGAIVLGIAYKYGLPYLGPKTQVILEPDASQVSRVNPSDLKVAAEILTARAHALGHSDISFTVADNNRIMGQVPSTIDTETVVKPMIAIGLLEFVDLGEIPLSEGTVVETDHQYPYFAQAKGKTWHTLITNNGFESVEAATDQVGKPAVSFKLTPEGTKIFADFTANHVGHYLGIVLDKVVLSSPVINSPIPAGSGVIQGSFTAQEASALAAYLRTRGPLPLPLVIKEVIQRDH